MDSELAGDNVAGPGGSLGWTVARSLEVLASNLIYAHFDSKGEISRILSCLYIVGSLGRPVSHSQTSAHPDNTFCVNSASLVFIAFVSVLCGGQYASTRWQKRSPQLKGKQR